MRRIVIGFLLVAIEVSAIGCNHPQPTDQGGQPPASSTPPPQPPAASQPEKSQTAAQTPAEGQGPVVDTPGLPAQKPSGPGQPMGTYTISEVHHKGVVTMIPNMVATQITFIPDGTFSRISKAAGKVNFKDSGQFVIEGQDQIILKIVMSEGKIQQPAVEKRHTFSLSEDGTELKMTGKDGRVAIFRR